MHVGEAKRSGICLNCTAPDACFQSYFPLAAKRLDALPEALMATLPSLAALQFYLGGNGSGAPLHHHNVAINAFAFGRKRWLLLPPSHAGWLHQPAAEWAAALEASNHERAEEERAADAHVLRCTQRAGDVLVLPEGWAHATVNTYGPRNPVPPTLATRGSLLRGAWEPRLRIAPQEPKSKSPRGGGVGRRGARVSARQTRPVRTGSTERSRPLRASDGKRRCAPFLEIMSRISRVF